MKSHPVVVDLMGGLGNQLFIWAAGYALASKLGVPLEIQVSGIRAKSRPGFERQYGLDYFGIEPAPQGKSSRRSVRERLGLGKRPSHSMPVFTESSFLFDREFLRLDSAAELRGYFQSFKYFESCSKKIRDLLVHQARPSDSALQILQDLGSEWIAVHVRRGDYLNHTDVYELPSSSYYHRAIGVAKEIAKVDRVVVFSESLDDAAVLVPGADRYLTSSELPHPGDVLSLMRTAKAFVGANSSLSWWGAFLGADQSRPTAFPRPWFKDDKQSVTDLLLPNWFTLGS